MDKAVFEVTLPLPALINFSPVQAYFWLSVLDGLLGILLYKEGHNHFKSYLSGPQFYTS